VSQEIVADDKVVIFHYTLTNDDGDQIDSSAGSDPLPYLHGAGNIVPGLEKEMTGKTIGDSFEVRVAPEEGYGQPSGNGPTPIPRETFPPQMDLQPGMPFPAELEDGSHITLWIVQVGDDQVLVDMDHPLAGEHLNFQIEIVGIRDAKDEEIAHGHPHGISGDEGHHH
jgi:FKBP-type peptidyl-prolyl cis-trans isomerase SlyD